MVTMLVQTPHAIVSVTAPGSFLKQVTAGGDGCRRVDRGVITLRPPVSRYERPPITLHYTPVSRRPFTLFSKWNAFPPEHLR